MVTYIPRGPEEITGSDLSGSEPDANRTYTLTHSNSIDAQFFVYLDGAALQYNKQYTKSGDTITFLLPIWDNQSIVIIYYTETQVGTSSASLRYTSALGFVKYLQALRTVPDRANTTPEEVGTGNNSSTRFFLDQLGVIDSTLTLYYGASASSLTELSSSKYSFDSDNSEITLTSAGVTDVGTDNIYAIYKWNQLELTNDEIENALKAAENRILRLTDQYFADATDADPAYRKVLNEVMNGFEIATDKVYEVFWTPMVNLSTTVNGAYTTGGTEITLDDGSGFPDAATIYIGGNKVTYTARSGNTLTVPSSTPSIADGAKVRGEVVELSREPEGNEPSYTVLDPGTDYKIDHLNGRILLLDNAYWGEINATDMIYPTNHLVRFTYFQAWHEENEDPTIPQDITELTYKIAAKKLKHRIISRAHIGQAENINPSALNIGETEIQQIVEDYKPLNVGTSPFNKTQVS